MVPVPKNPHMKRTRTAQLALAFLLPFLLSGCIGLMPSPFRPSPGPTKGPQMQDLAEAFDIVCRNYRLGPDDVISVMFQTEWSIPMGTYRLDTLDEVNIEFILDPDLNRKVTIRPDGMITLPGIGEVQAAGQTPEELGKRIEQRYRQANIFKESQLDPKLKNFRLVTVSVLRFYEKIKKLVEALTTLTGGQQSIITVKPDGTIDLPLLKDRILASGNTISDIERTVNRAYRQGELKQVVASLALSSAKSRKFYVLGEVAAPGAYDIRQPITAIHALAMAGGHIRDSADLTSVILISKDIHGRPIGRRLDLKRLFDVGDMSSAIMVKAYDVLYVPKTYIMDLRLFMDQYIATASQIANFVSTLIGVRNL